MKLFQTYQGLLPVLIGYDKLKKYGFKAPNPIKKYLCRFTSILGYFVLVGSIFLTGGSIAFVAKTFREYTDNVPILITAANDTLIFVTLRWRFTEIFEMIKNYEILIEERK